jgi:hypothetical protein
MTTTAEQSNDDTEGDRDGVEVLESVDDKRK